MPSSTTATPSSAPGIMAMTSAFRLALSIFFAVCTVSFTIRLCINLAQHPLFSPPDRPGDWDRQWLITTVFDFYGVVLVLGATIAISERQAGATWPVAAGWTAAMCCLGCPVAFCWAVYTLMAFGTLPRPPHGKARDPLLRGE